MCNGTPILDLYRKYAAETFPIAFGHRDPVSYPVDADLREQVEMWVGEVDENSRDVLTKVSNGSVYVGSHYLGGSYPPGISYVVDQDARAVSFADCLS